MAQKKYPQVWRDGKWYAMFTTLKDAEAWVKKQTAGTYEINEKTPDRKQIPTTIENGADKALDAAIAATKQAKETADVEHQNG